ncbi:MAG: T9SS type A sorting domain-containing protein [Candidatus Marinimicrobia bacterium]|jgi:hypothetical protein|nr:T9SS type A sorting domain-containing protein [Candidatus Neomarinimicrobiota bacterium]MBT3961549.1 T9SS type A sorting domain-containing protein [Candidatus Neomarinimicrobiota bacterium]MBT4382063.1 T9SS type A sorting domain-containing protein [Candidatus Neomarinimicrobiota bacterium]MBT4636082.1 T9SS type A sorting domain-containing protein [Candidatus Neomarinimicrobiota bacterium]MBT4685900.1 T9SS type A sorting domain-containing protein [Candidatus Neomarinimicrobiota bacterium]
MIKTTLKKILQAILTFMLGIALANNSPDENNFLDLDIQEGQGSILLSWTIPDTISISEIRLFSKTSYNEDFTNFKLIEPKKRKYLDTSCVEKERYFYYLEISDLFGRTVSSDINHPTFGTCLQKESKMFIDGLDPGNLVSLFKIKQSQMIHSLIPDLQPNIILSLVDLFYRETLNDFAWIENIPLREFPNLENDFSAIHSYYNNFHFSDSIHIYKEYYQNQFLLFDKDWNALEKKIELKMINNLNYLNDQFSNNLDFIHSIDPIRIIQKRSIEENQYVSLLIIRENDISWEDLFLLNGDTYLDIIKPEESAQTQRIEMAIPVDWASATLVHRGEWIQNIQFIPELDQMSISLNNEYFVPKDNQIWKVEIPQPASIINEIHFANHLLQFEIMSQTNQFESYSLWHNDDIIFEWSPMLSAETIYTDTSITLFDKDSINIQWIRWRTQSDQDDWQDFEWIPINTIQETHLAKSPDGGQWEETQEFTLGKSNSTEALFESESLIPEIFVLYQNYPNPFNSKTRISFDLLENATVSLFIFDANGRIIDQFVESEYLQSGAYNFSWDATGHPTGIYFFTIQTMVNGFEPVTFSRKMIYLK